MSRLKVKKPCLKDSSIPRHLLIRCCGIIGDFLRRKGVQEAVHAQGFEIVPCWKGKK